MEAAIRSYIKPFGAIALAVMLSACQPLYSSPSGNIAGSSGVSAIALSNLSVAEVSTRPAQQVRNHLIFLLSGGANPLSPTHEVRLRVSTIDTELASKVSNQTSGQIGNTAGVVKVVVSYDVYDFTSKQTVFSGNRSASAAYDKTSQSFATSRAVIDAENRAAKAAAEQIRLALAADLSR